MLDLKLFAITLFILVIFYLGLSINVIRQRRINRVAIGDQNNPNLLRAIRAHANCAEYAPLILLALYVLEKLHINPLFMAVLCIAFLIGRVTHAFGLICLELQQPPRFWARSIGMSLTFLCLLISAITILIYSFCK